MVAFKAQPRFRFIVIVSHVKSKRQPARSRSNSHPTAADKEPPYLAATPYSSRVATALKPSSEVQHRHRERIDPCNSRRTHTPRTRKGPSELHRYLQELDKLARTYERREAVMHSATSRNSTNPEPPHHKLGPRTCLSKRRRHRAHNGRSRR